MKNYVKPELILIESFSCVDVLSDSAVDLKENDYFNFGNLPGGDY